MTQIELSNKLELKLVDHMGTDSSVVNAARVSLNQHKVGEGQIMSEKDVGLINFLMKNRHSSTFEHCQVSFLIEAPIFVVREWQRSRTQSFNETSGRYTELKPLFYAPDHDRPLVQVGKPGAYSFTASDDVLLHVEVLKEFRHSCQTAWNAYQHLLEKGVAKEVARMVLPVSIYTSWYATANLRNWIYFLSLRTDEQAMYEIRNLAFQVEKTLFDLYPVTMTAWDKLGRGPI